MKVCPTCSATHLKRGTYCSTRCYHAAPVSAETRRKMSLAGKGKPKSQAMRERLSRSTTGVPKPWAQGEKNVNFGGKCMHDEKVWARFRDGTARRGQAWTEEHRRAHGERMRGPTNAMRGKKHTPESVRKMSAAKRAQYEEGVVKIRRYKISRAEREIAAALEARKVAFEPQFHIPGVPFLYDFYLRDLNLIIEYQGDYWHANPLRHESGSYLQLGTKGRVLVDAIWARDAEKKQRAQEKGYKVVYIWETDYRREGTEEALRCAMQPA